MSRTYSKIDVDQHYRELIGILREVIALPAPIDRYAMRDILRQYPKDGKGFFGRDELIHAYYVLTERGDLPE
ncbi:MAG: hypothetical protein AAFR22_17005, partial [Chloroflexota bacterium]